MKKSNSPRRPVYIQQSNTPKRRKKKASASGFRKFILLILVILIGTGIFFSIDKIIGYQGREDPSLTAPDPTATDIPIPTASPTPVPWHNPILLDGRMTTTLSMQEILDAAKPAALEFSSQIYKGNTILTDYQRTTPVALFDPFDYSEIAGVITFRGNNFRNAPAFGEVTMQEKKLEQIWERSMGGMASSSWSFSWSGTGWTGQPVMVQWPDDIRQMMNLYPEKKTKEDLVEVITASMDGNIYFYDLEDGTATRPPIKIGVVVKGTPALDPRGYPILYVGQGDYPPKNPGGEMGFRIFNLIDQSLLYFGNTAKDIRAIRPNWGALDSSPIIDGKADTLIYPCENGMIYTAKLNTVFDRTTATIRMTPEFVDYKYKSNATKGQGIESSIAVYGGYGFFADNSGALNCININTMQPVWAKKLDDDNDVTPSLKQTDKGLFLYCGTEVDDQKTITGSYQGDAYIYKINALNGEVLWRNSYKAWTYNDPGNSGNDINGGIMGSLIVGKGKQSNLIIASVCMTNGYMSGNTIAAFDDETGDLVWDYPMNQYTWSSPVDVYDSEGNMYILIADSASQIHLIDGSNGQRLDVIQIKRNYLSEEGISGGNIESSPAVFGDILVIGTRGGLLAGVKLK